MDKITEEIIKSISEIVRFDSSQAEPAEGAPFGKGAKEALDWFLSLAESFGFETNDYQGYAGEVIFGEGKEFAILAHLDVVPAGSGWTHDPFGGEIDYKNRKVWGRGTTDDKGPAIIALYALKSLKDEGFKPNRKIKLIVGCNEENGWECMNYYCSHAHMPEEGISPDAEFPVIYAEKGILHVKFDFKVDGDFSSLAGGERPNMVCDRCVYEGRFDVDKAISLGLSVEDGKVVSRGKSAHGSTPDEGINAIPPVLKLLGLGDIEKKLFETRYGLTELSDETGNLTFSPDVIEGKDGHIYVTCDIRYPATYKEEDILKRLDGAGESYEVLHRQYPLYNDKNCFLIKTLCGVYNEVTGKNVEPIAIGGGTYARVLKCGAAFGPEELDEESTIHQADEYMSFDTVEKCYKIYRLAAERLTK